MYYIIFVVIGLIVSSLIFLFSQNIVKKVYHKDISKKAEDRIFFVTALFCFGAPIIYEFKPLFFSPQYEISRGVDGNILDLKPDVTGFHLPFCSSEKFVCLPKSVKDMKGKVTNVTDYGAFIEIKNGIEGLVHSSEISWVKANQNAKIIQLGIGNLWKLAVDHPKMKVEPCIHRAPEEKSGQKRLLLIC